MNNDKIFIKEELDKICQELENYTNGSATPKNEFKERIEKMYFDLLENRSKWVEDDVNGVGKQLYLILKLSTDIGIDLSLMIDLIMKNHIIESAICDEREVLIIESARWYGKFLEAWQEIKERKSSGYMAPMSYINDLHFFLLDRENQLRKMQSSSQEINFRLAELGRIDLQVMRMLNKYKEQMYELLNSK